VQLFWKPLTIALAILSITSCNALAVEKIILWPTILFLRGQDLCQYQDAYGQTRNESTIQATNHLKELLYAGVDSNAAVGILMAVDGLIDKNRALATAGQGMDITLEASLKAGIDAISQGINPENTRLEFANNIPVQFITIQVSHH